MSEACIDRFCDEEKLAIAEHDVGALQEQDGAESDDRYRRKVGLTIPKIDRTTAPHARSSSVVQVFCSQRRACS